jgi:hypothetical protein
MSRNRSEHLLEEEEAAQGQDLYRAPGDELHMVQARDQAEASGWIADEKIVWPSDQTQEGVVARRQELYDAMRRLEASVARPSGLADWRIEIEAALANLQEALVDHVGRVDGETGLFSEILEQAPHLAGDVVALRREHEELMSACRLALSMSADWAPGKLRRRTNVLLGRLAIHRQYGAELLFDAYNVDLAGGE